MQSASHRKCILLSGTEYHNNKLLTNQACSGRSGKWWHSVVFVWTSLHSVRAVTGVNCVKLKKVFGIWAVLVTALNSE